jgi:hypothetical protein
LELTECALPGLIRIDGHKVFPFQKPVRETRVV